MSNTSCFIGGKEITVSDRNEFMSKVKNVRIGVFFDGTNNNAVQRAIFESYKKQKKIESLSSDAKEKYERAIKLKKELLDLQIQEMLASVVDSSNYATSTINQSELSSIRYKIKEREKELEKTNFQPLFDTEYMHANKSKGYSNVSILYSLLQHNMDTQENVYHNIYIEGAGACDITELLPSNANGLGFGLGKTGVTALVSKALKEITDWLQSMKNHFDENTKYHFYIFGFSRGSTCARLFAELTTRDPDKKLKREDEFAQETSRVSHLMKGSRIPFMEEAYLGGNPKIKRDNVTVDFLGIYDTVASIGFLKQKDGWTNSLSWAYRAAWWNNYNGNFHYMNVHDYGLYSPHNQRVKYTCHICAGDEFRENFALVNLGKKIPKNSMEIIIPGCHSDIGGGYVDGVEMDIVLYKFIPRKFERFLKSNKMTEIIGTPYLRFVKERAKMFVEKPSNLEEGKKEELSPDTLAKLGWVGKEYEKDTKDTLPERSHDDEVCTKRVADWPNEIKFKRYAMRGYSNIPLQMMIKCVEKCGITNLFKLKTYPYEIPIPLKSLGTNLKNAIEKPSGQRLWMIPGGSYSSEEYRKLRLNFLHFTASCEMFHFRTRVDKNKRTNNISKEAIEGREAGIAEWNKANIGNNCNYDNEANICRIMYDGDEALKGDHKNNVHYMYDLYKYGVNEEKC